MTPATPEHLADAALAAGALCVQGWRRDPSGRVYVTLRVDATVTLEDGQMVEVKRDVEVRATRQSRKPKRLNHARI